MFGLTVVTAPTTEPISLAEAARQVRVPTAGGAYDQDLNRLIIAARVYCERVTGKAFISQTLRLTRDCFPGWKENNEFRLPMPPLQTVTNIQYTDTAGVTQTVDSTSYVVDATAMPGRITLAWGEVWPTDVLEQAATVKVNYVAGYGAATAVPQTIKQAMLMLIAHWFENREAAITGTIQTATEMAVSALLGCEFSGSLAGTYG